MEDTDPEITADDDLPLGDPIEVQGEDRVFVLLRMRVNEGRSGDTVWMSPERAYELRNFSTILRDPRKPELTDPDE